MVSLETQIIEQTIQLFQEKGLKFTLEELTTQLRISKKTIYQYFSSKEAILNAVVDYGFAKIQANKRHILESDVTIVDKLQSVLIAMPQEYESFDFRALKDLETTYPAVAANVKQHFEADWEPIFELIEQGVQAKVVKPVNVVVLKLMLTAAFDAFMSAESLEDSGLTYREALIAMIDIVMHGLHQGASEDALP
ncbi:TetR/AcrR family transcriptional regulator [Aerococcaceae bacterium zg-BR9]|uniref:TetR/AcrR family transcriptional regulator n=1 Tax=Aerococcaceae bacterium zg-1292 TaxID=2774330 RepID=UPI0040647B90|nr:TetR/AcrR family transcriptional regulator [Aerococcaceae bacterium zg-BR9]